MGREIMDRKKQTYVAIPLLILVLIGSGWFYVNVVKVRADYNRIVDELVNTEKYAEAAEALEPLQERASGQLRETIRLNLAEVYRLLGDAPESTADDSVRHYERSRELDPRFGMTYWGEAMTYDNPFLTDHDGGEYERLGEDVVTRMDALDAAGELDWTEREAGYANAVRWRFATNYSFTERRQGYLEAMEDLSLRYPDDDEATVFSALALMALPGFDRELPVHVVTVAGYLEQVRTALPDR